MMRPILVLAVILSMAGTAPAVPWSDTLFDKTSFDFGPVPRGPVQSYSFRLSNKTQGPVHIFSVRVPCSCLSASVAKKDLAAGESTTVDVQLDTRRLSGPFKKTIFVQFDRPEQDEVGLSIQANVRDNLLLAPEALAFGRIGQGSYPEARVTVLISGMDCKILQAKSESYYIQTEVRQLPPESGALSFQVAARLRPDLPVGTWQSTVWVTTDNPALPRFPIPLTVEVRKVSPVVKKGI